MQMIHQNHAWTYRIEKVRQQLEEIQGLAERMVALMHLDTVNKDRNDVIELVIQEMWKYNQTYSIQNQEFSAEDKLPVWYIMDEFGSHIRHSDQPTFKTAPLFYMPNQICYTILWPVKDMDYADEVTRDFASEVRDPVLRKIRLSPWQPADFTSINTKHLELDIEYYRGVCNENWASEEELDESLLQPQRNKVNKVYTNNEQVLNFLKHPNFEIVETEEEADILWYMEHFKEFKTLALNTKKYVNQFPCESLLTTKDMLARTARRASPSDQDGPKWLAKTFDLLQELPQFVSYYQQKQQSGEDNIWICKCWNLSRSLGHTVTDNLSEIIRLTETNYPQIACEYISDPVLFYRDNVGQVKMDLCYTVFLASVKPVKLFLHRNFSLRFAYKPFSLDHFDDYGKHFTVMNYADSKKLLQIHWHEFIPKFEEQNPDFKWKFVEEKLFDAIRQFFQAAVSEPPPKGLAHNPQSRALYSLDLMLKWVTNSNNEKSIQPILLEVNYCPDSTRMETYNPGFYNSVFSALFLDEIEDSRITRLL
ncbi:tubulin--tyrosine ligase-like protein 12 isoform X4 [Ptychodera flava]|uniref:tubulin--tyrosine ligase-like protein 12 isoform X4 n=1 Tax=Ptychodera flava TaxID=63121 RepID=UPI003969CAEA